MYDVVPDLHGDLDRLERTLHRLGYRQVGGRWTPPRGRKAAFLGDFIHGGPDNGAVLAAVWAMLEAGNAVAVKGNHELNALHFHNNGPDGRPLRGHAAKNVAQHATFMREFPYGHRAPAAWVERFVALPLLLDLGDLRLVHA